MKKVCFVTDSLYSGGAERVMSVLANEFTSIYDVTIISKAHIKPFFYLNCSVSVIYPKTKINYRNFLTTLWGRINMYLDLASLLKSEKPDLVITFCSRTNGTVIPIAKLLGLKVIASEHLNYKFNSKVISIAFIKRFIYPFANVLTVLTERDKLEYYDRYMKNVVVMPNPLSLVPAEKIDVEKKKDVILAIGDVSRWEHKGFDTLLLIFSRIMAKYPSWNLEIAGSGDQTNVRKFIEDRNIGDRVELLGEVKDIESLMQKSKIYALASRWEGLPMVLIEAMSQGLPCVAFDCFSGPREIITNGVDGILVHDQDVDAFVDALSDLIDKPEKRVELGYQAINTSHKYNTAEIFSRWENLIDDILHVH